MAARAGAIADEPGEDLMADVIDRLTVAMNAHDLDAVAGLIHEDYRSEQPAHPGRAFTGRAQMLANWEAMLAGIPDFHAEICRSVRDGDTTWTEWRWSGARSDGQAFEMRGVTLFEVADDQIVAGRLYMEDVERDVAGIEQAVEALSGRRPRSARWGDGEPQLGLRARRAQASTRRALKPPGLGRAVLPELPVAALCATLALQGGNRDRARRPSPGFLVPAG
jgi:limonene-1,2-epoxide hydrolase